MNWIKKIFTNQSFHIPTLDGIRALAVLMVVMSHLSLQVTRINGLEATDFTYTDATALLLELCGNGVSIFFCLSAFLLCIPFIKKIEQEKSLQLPTYYKRRFQRLHMPYVIVLLALLMFRLVVQEELWQEEIPHFIASFFYQHNIIYGRRSTINPVAWTLEIEIQFYLILPLLIQIFRIRTINTRRISIIALVILTIFVYKLTEPYLDEYHLRFSVIPYLPVFFMGFLLADFFLQYQQVLMENKNFVADGLLILGLYGVLYYNNTPNIAARLVEMISYVAIFYGAFSGKIFGYLFTRKWWMFMGIISYSIYLLHYAIIIFVTNQFAKIITPNGFHVDMILYGIILIPIIIVISTVFYKTIESRFKKKKITETNI